MNKNKVLITSTDLSIDQSTGKPFDQVFLSTIIDHFLPDFTPVLVDGFKGVGDYLGNYDIVRAQHLTYDELINPGRSKIENDVVGIVIPYLSSAPELAFEILHTTQLLHISDAIKNKYQEDLFAAQDEGLDSTVESLKQSIVTDFYKIFDIPHSLEVNGLYPGKQSRHVLDQDDVFSEPSLFKKMAIEGYQTWLSHTVGKNLVNKK